MNAICKEWIEVLSIPYIWLCRYSIHVWVLTYNSYFEPIQFILHKKLFQYKNALFTLYTQITVHHTVNFWTKQKPPCTKISKTINIRPEYRNSLVVPSQSHYSSGRPLNLFMPGINITTYGLRSFRYQCTILWNSLYRSGRPLNLFMPGINTTTYGLRSFRYQCTILWNSLYRYGKK